MFSWNSDWTSFVCSFHFPKMAFIRLLCKYNHFCFNPPSDSIFIMCLCCIYCPVLQMKQDKWYIEIKHAHTYRTLGDTISKETYTELHTWCLLLSPCSMVRVLCILKIWTSINCSGFQHTHNRTLEPTRSYELGVFYLRVQWPEYYAY